MQNKLESYIVENFNGHAKIEKKREGIFQLYIPIYHEDGDMVDIFIEETTLNNFKISDYGMTLQRLNYSYDIDSENKEAIFQKIILENGVKENDGNISIESDKDSIFQNILHLTQVLAKIGSMRLFKREIIERRLI